jgi:hypothetical protein
MIPSIHEGMQKVWREEKTRSVLSSPKDEGRHSKLLQEVCEDEGFRLCKNPEWEVEGAPSLSESKTPRVAQALSKRGDLVIPNLLTMAKKRDLYAVNGQPVPGVTSI